MNCGILTSSHSQAMNTLSGHTNLFLPLRVLQEREGQSIHCSVKLWDAPPYKTIRGGYKEDARYEQDVVRF